MLPVGGITPDKMAAYRAAGAAGFGLGSALYKPGDTAADVAAKAAAFAAAWRGRALMTTSFRPFALEELLSRHEQGVDFHFAESGVDPLGLATLLNRPPDSRAGASGSPSIIPRLMARAVCAS